MKTSSAHHNLLHALFMAILAGTAFSCLVSCSKPAPETPMERSRVLLRLFGDLDRKDNAEALKSIETYHNLEPTDPFLPELEHIVRANSVIAAAKAKLPQVRRRQQIRHGRQSQGRSHGRGAAPERKAARSGVFR